MIISFDCYGTLVDWESGIVETVKSVFEKYGKVVESSEILKLYSQIEPELEKTYKPYKEVLKLVMKKLGEHFGIKLSEVDENALVDSIGNWPVFPDTTETLKKIKELHKIAVISNVDDDIFKLTQEKIGVKFDYIITAQRVGAYKPSMKVFKYAYREFKVSKNEWIHVAQSIFHDIIPAKKFGVKTILVKRRGFGATPEAYEDADYIAENLKDVIEILNEIA